jgi:hypothetical protein
MLGGGLTPNQGLSETLERLHMFVEQYKISGLKLYTFDSTPARGWWFDDEKRAYPIWGARRLSGALAHPRPAGRRLRSQRRNRARRCRTRRSP